MELPRRLSRILPVLALTALASPSGSAAVDPLHQWPAWRGPMANGVAPHANPPTEWAEDRNIRWKVAVPGRGTATPAVWDDQVFVLTAIPTGQSVATSSGGGGRGGMTEAPTHVQQFTVLSLDRTTGKVRWQKTAREQLPHAGHHRDHGFASASPVTDGEVLIAHFNSFGTYAYDLRGTLLWEKDLGDMQTRNGFGEGSSPVLHGDTVVILWDHEGQDFIVALDKRTGTEKWRRERDEPTGWCTPLVVEHAGRHQVVVNGTRQVCSYDLETGDLLWTATGQTANAIPSAVTGHGRAYVMSGFRGSALQAIPLDRRGAVSGDGFAWTHGKNTPYVPSPLLYGDRLYFIAGNNAMLSVFDAPNGKPLVDAERIDGVFGVYASPLGAADRVYLVGRDGNSVVFRKGDSLEVLARNRLDDGFDASPVAVGNELLLRGRQSLYCIAAE